MPTRSKLESLPWVTATVRIEGSLKAPIVAADSAGSELSNFNPVLLQRVTHLPR
jgi:hypothetical protein